jgi:50S ribosomal subunit-associated GTPase HflX
MWWGRSWRKAGLASERRIVVALNKADKLSQAEREERLAVVREQGWEAELVSAVRGDGLADLGIMNRRVFQAGRDIFIGCKRRRGGPRP